jgi:hypothetical protein
MTYAERSYWKTILPAAIAAAACAVAALVLATYRSAFATAAMGGLLVVSVAFVAIVVAGVTVVWRARYAARHKRDAYLVLNERKSERALGATRAALGDLPWQLIDRLIRRQGLRTGDVVEVASLAEIERTLDPNACHGGLPFMPEMARFCGQRFRVFRVVDKIYDYGRSKTMRRLEDAVLLTGLRCDGGAHGGCQAACYLIWKTAWLKRVDSEPDQGAARSAAKSLGTAVPAIVAAATQAGPNLYRCQYTQLAASSAPIPRRDLRPDLRPLLRGNLSTRAFLLAIATRIFNAVQIKRGGIGFPHVAAGTLEKTPAVNLGLTTSQSVRVLDSEAISRTLDKTWRNRGLWFDRDMVKYCGGEYRVLARVERIIDDATGRMLQMKTPSIMLDEVDGTGEFLRFNAQHDYLFWRECWLETTAPHQQERPTS